MHVHTCTLELSALYLLLCESLGRAWSINCVAPFHRHRLIINLCVYEREREREREEGSSLRLRLPPTIRYKRDSLDKSRVACGDPSRAFTPFRTFSYVGRKERELFFLGKGRWGEIWRSVLRGAKFIRRRFGICGCWGLEKRRGKMLGSIFFTSRMRDI